MLSFKRIFKALKNSITIRKFSAALLLLLFLFSITPKKYFHDLIADHIDNLIPVKKDTSFDDAGYNCHFEKLVAESPFTEIAETRFHFRSPEFVAEKNGTSKTFITSFCPSNDNKGPPARI